jgi:dTDP-4-dehydrorhamnose 3,5-epimerase
VDGEPMLSDRDRDAPTLSAVQAEGLLPTWDETQAFLAKLRTDRDPRQIRNL